MAKKMFPIMVDKKYRDICPTSVLFAIVEAHEKQAQRNHQQSVQRLSERGGLAPCELLAVLEDRPWHKMDHQDAIDQLVSILEDTRVCVGCGAVFHPPVGAIINMPGGVVSYLCIPCFQAGKDESE